jgi:arylsulfatase A-like enzyme
MYDCTLKVPLIVWSRGRFAPARCDSLVQLIDVAPTILEAAGIEVPADWEARSLAPLLEGRQAAIRDKVYAELARDHIQSAAEYIVMQRDERWKIVYYLGEDGGELYDLAADPGETRNLWNDERARDVRERLLREVFEWSMRGALRARMPSQRRPQQPMLI